MLPEAELGNGSRRNLPRPLRDTERVFGRRYLRPRELRQRQLAPGHTYVGRGCERLENHSSLQTSGSDFAPHQTVALGMHSFQADRLTRHETPQVQSIHVLQTSPG